ncbi:glycosyl hydrolase family 81 protein [Tasmannia lanceolata]|uniref:glycosyl hydrolase family 81 protein n=1 Tax=Tasmannia lanceolata TaxID=3420 RepID=UPI004062813D
MPNTNFSLTSSSPIQISTIPSTIPLPPPTCSNPFQFLKISFLCLPTKSNIKIPCPHHSYDQISKLLTVLVNHPPFPTNSLHLLTHLYKMNKKLKKIKTLLSKSFKKLPRLSKRPNQKTPNQSPPNQGPPNRPEPTSTMPPPAKPTSPFLFPKTPSSIIPDPTVFFSPHLLSSPLPTNSFFQNFVLKNGDQPEYIHPYLIKTSSSSLSLSYPSRFSTSSFIYQTFTPDLTISAPQNTTPTNHIISSFNDLSLTLDLPPSLKFFLVRGSPYLTCTTTTPTQLSISTVHAILTLSSNPSLTKHTLTLNNNQTWICYSSSPLNLTQSTSLLTISNFSGVLRFAVVPQPDPLYEIVLDRFSSCYPISGNAEFTKPFCLQYKWEKKGWGDLLLLAHPLHVRLLSDEGDVAVLEEFKYNSIDGELVGVIGDSWVLKTDPISVTWHSVKGIKEESYMEIVSALTKDVEGLKSSPITTSSSYFYGKAIARAARLALIAEEVCYPDVIPVVRQFLNDSITPWLDGSFNGNGFLYDPKWGGIVTKQGSLDSGADFGFGIYNDHHYHLGYFLYGIAVLSKIDPAWGRKYRPQAYSMMADFMNLGRHSNSNYTRLRCFDMWKLHSWAGGLTEFADGRNQESTSEAINAYYSASLMGLSYGDSHLVAIGSTMAAMEIKAAQTWWHVREGEGRYEEEFSRENRVVGVLWANKRDSALWFAPPEWRECRLGIQVLPLLPITEIVFSDVGFVRELVKWTLPALKREGVGEGWKGFAYAMEGVYDKETALEKIRSLNGFDDGNSLSNLLWWVHSRGDGDEEGHGGGRLCLFGYYCH